MALSGLDIYKLLPKTNCKACGYATCLAFAMALAQKKTSLDKCPPVSPEAKIALESASQPPIKLVTVGVGEKKLEMGNETVMYRHELKFVHPAGIGFLVEDSLSDADISSRVEKINALKFERVGLHIAPDAICVSNASKDAARFAAVVKSVAAGTSLALVLVPSNAAAAEAALAVSKEKRPLLVCEDPSVLDAYIALAKANNVPLSVRCAGVEEASGLTERIRKGGVEEIVLNVAAGAVWKTLQAVTYMRRAALRKSARAVGYPVMSFTGAGEPSAELAEALTYVTKYASLVIVRNITKEFVLPLLVARQDIYTDPQKPVQVESKVYEIGKVTQTSPVIVTTNFSITYFTVAGEVEASRVPTYIVCCDAEGMSVLTAWAAEKFTPERIAATLKKCGIETSVTHRNVTIPGYVAVLSSKLADESGWKVHVGPREASGITNYLRNFKG